MFENVNIIERKKTSPKTMPANTGLYLTCFDGTVLTRRLTEGATFDEGVLFTAMFEGHKVHGAFFVEAA